MAVIYAYANPLSGALSAGDPSQAAADPTPDLAAAVTVSGLSAAQLQSVQALAAAVIASASAAANAAIKQAMQAAAAGSASVSGGLTVTGGNAKCVSKILLNSTLTAVPQQGAVKWAAINLAATPPSLVASAVDGTIDFFGRLTVQHPSLQVGVEYGISAFTADGYSVATRITAEQG